MVPTEAQMNSIVGRKTDASNVRSIIGALGGYGALFGLDIPHRLAHYISQLAHESGGFKYDKEIWGPTPAQKRYDTRVDLGNTAAVDGDGKLYAGRGPIQITGKSNYRQFTDWCQRNIGNLKAPDFVEEPDRINTDPWEGLTPIWYWSTRKLNDFADENNIEMVTKRINGGLNGYDDRIRFYVRTSLVFLGYEPEDVKGFQKAAQEAGFLPPDKPGHPQVDGDAGPQTRAAMHKMMAAMTERRDVETKAAPVVEKTVVVEEVEVEKPVAVVPKGADKPGIGRWLGSIPLLGAPIMAFTSFDNVTKAIIGGAVFLAIVALLWRGEQIAMRARKVLASFDE
jgi:putative chitinase